MIGWLMIVLFTSGLILLTVHQNGRTLGVNQLSAFGDWQLTNNAMLMYEKIPEKERKSDSVPKKFAALHKVVTHYIDTLQLLSVRHDGLNGYYSNDYYSPLHLYGRTLNKTNYYLSSKQMVALAPLYREYGLYLIKKYPTDYLHYYVKPNLSYYLLPPDDILRFYNNGQDTIQPLAKKWFSYKTNKVSTYLKRKDYEPFRISTILVPVTTMVFLVANFFYFISGAYKMETKQFHMVLSFMYLYWILNLFFSVLAAPIIFRYQLFNMILCFSFSILLAGSLLKKDNSTS
ncbi:hypothetical protein [Chitinophaga sp. YR573]|uniref:hypothetical protein n=1 Tax=Chitinophaga sp. YR573 TaxID=1881040 RepID=UPI000B7EC443|nr:hypothetical protein [Chitinophaga sp. YR573]